MVRQHLHLTIAALAALSVPVGANPAIEVQSLSGGIDATFPPYLQCVPYARQVSGIAIYGDAHTWWSQAEGRYAKGREPRPGAVMAFPAHGNMRLGHVAAVSRIIDSRNVLVRHSNWSPINGRRGQIEDDVRVIDVSPGNDWSRVRVWFDPIKGLGTTEWPVRGFIYKQRPRETSAAATQIAAFDDPIGDIIRSRTR